MATSAPIPNPDPIGDQLFQARLKANEFVQEHLKTVVTIASGTLVLTVSFVKDIVGRAAVPERWPGLLAFSWATLGLSVFVGVFTLATLVNNLDDADMEEDEHKVPKAFSAGKQGIVVRWVQITILLFGCGIVSLAAFGVINYRLFLNREAPSDKDKQAVFREQPNVPAARFAIASTPRHTVARHVIGSHTFLLDQVTGQVWEMVCSKGQLVTFRKIPVEDIPASNLPVPDRSVPAQ